MTDAYIVYAKRSAIGKYAGVFSTIRPDDLVAQLLKQIQIDLPQIDYNEIEEVILGAANQAGEDNRNVARMAVLLSGLPVSIAGVTVNRLCASGLQSIADAARAIQCGHGNAIIAGGVESMTRAPMVMAKSASAWARQPEIYDTTIGWRFTNPALASLYHPFNMGETAENVAKKWNITREAQDEFAYNSQKKYQEAYNCGNFKKEIIPISILNKKETIKVETDEHPRLSSIEELANLKPAFEKNGTVTAGNASGINDGAAICLVCNESFIKKYGLTPVAKVAMVAAAGVDPSIMGIGPVASTQKLLKKANLQVNDIDEWEINEAFASQSIACIQELGIDNEKVNSWGGAIALGHPLGASGTRITTTLLHRMMLNKTSKKGIATMCVGVGQGLSILYEKC